MFLILAQATPTIDPVVDSLLRAGPLGVLLVGAWLLWPKVVAWRAAELAASKERDQAFLVAARERDQAFLSGQRELSSAFQNANERILDRADRAHERAIGAIQDVREELHGLRADVHSLTTGNFQRLPAPTATEPKKE